MTVLAKMTTTLDELKQTLQLEASATKSSSRQPLSDTQYSSGFDVLARGSGRVIYGDFIVPQLSQVLSTLLESRTHVSVLEIGPGSRSVLDFLPALLRWKIRKYTALKPNVLFATRLEIGSTASKTRIRHCLV